jgi:16S rRNA C967 or C1407 C5-methylase (RsmB/RsmF family)/NOL1/NOP2/fmu family ribosome biogenesis protein
LAANIPAELIRSLSKMDHFDPVAFLSVHQTPEQPVSVHMNMAKPILQKGHWTPDMAEPPFEISGTVPWAPDAYYLSSRPSFTLDPLFHAGTYYVQESSGMFLAFALTQTIDLSQKLRVLDLCAAPGGKSTLIQSLISPESLLLSNEVMKSRVPVLYQNMTKWGHANGMISNSDPAQFKQLPGFFDLLLVDAPCSGSGLFRKDPDAARVWSPDLVRLCSQRQQRILRDAWESLKDDGFLIYSTCSYSKEENEDILDFIFEEFACLSVSLHPDPGWNVVETASERFGVSGYRFYPDKVLGEGFFLSVIQKKQAVSSLPVRTKQVHSNKMNRDGLRIPASVEQQIGIWIQEGSGRYIPVGDSFHAIAPGLLHDFEMLKNVLYLKKAGVRIGKAGERNWIPDQELALANILRDDIESLELSRSDVLRFLRGESFDPGTSGKGWRIVCFMGHRLGWVKLLDKRINNYYPKSWRIRH